MDHPTLGLLKPKDTDGNSYEGEIKSEGYKVALNIELDSAVQAEVFKFVESVVSYISSLDVKAKSIIGRDLLETYNSGWNEFDEVQKDGSTKTIVNPKLDSEQFTNQFELGSINVSGIDCIEFWYKPNELFWGHSVFVTSFDGIEFNDSNTQMFG